MTTKRAKPKPIPKLDLHGKVPITMQGEAHYIPDITVKGMPGRYHAVLWLKNSVRESK